VLVLSDLAQLLGVGQTRAWHLERDHAFEAFELLPRIGKRRRYSGKKVQAWLDGELASAPAQMARPFGSSRKSGQ
jgi:hypothetical protein